MRGEVVCVGGGIPSLLSYFLFCVLPTVFAYLCAPPICVSILAETSDPSGRFFRSGLALGLARFLLGLPNRMRLVCSMAYFLFHVFMLLTHNLKTASILFDIIDINRLSDLFDEQNFD